MTPDQLAHAIVEANQLPFAYLEIRRTKAMSVVLNQVSIVDSEGAGVNLSEIDD
jgi:hypothetical protein